MGAAGGIICFFAATTLKHALGYDDSLDAFGVHGVGGTLGAILTGVFAVANIPPVYADKPFGLVQGGTGVFTAQILATLLTWVIAVVGAFILLKIVDVVIGLRVTEGEEYDGLDITQHGESGYNLEDAFGGTFTGGTGSHVSAQTEASSASGKVVTA